MKKTDYGILFLVALIFFTLIATYQKVPGYMDAEYYFGQGLRLVQHQDLSESFIWNYLNNPTSTNGPGFAFWLPLTSFIAAGGLWITDSSSYFAARLVFILMASCIALMAAFFATQLLPGRRAGWLAGLLTLFSGFYLPFITITDTFTPYMLFGGFFFSSLWFAEKRSLKGSLFNFWFLASGVLAGLMSLTRSDGLLWLAGGLVTLFLIKYSHKQKWKAVIIHGLLITLGFALVMTPWYVRNYSLYQSIMPPGNSLMLWLTKYDDLFVYPSSKLTISNWISTGVGAILTDRLKALLSNLQTLIASGGMIFMAPIMAIGLWKTRNLLITRMALVSLFAMFVVMTIFFPYAGERGGFFHSLSAIQVIFWSMVPVGLDGVIQWGVVQRKWKTARSWKMFGPAIVIVAGIFSALLFSNKLANGTESGIPWNQTLVSFATIDKALVKKTGDQAGVILVNDPPGYTLATGRTSIMIPTGGENALIDVSNRYKARFLVLNGERADVVALLDNNSSVKAHFEFLFETAGTSVYEFKP